MSLRLRKFLCLVVLLVGLPAYIVAALVVVDWFDRPPVLVEFAIYVILGVIWAFPLKALFRGVARAEPEHSSKDQL